ncbi:MAG: thioesterase family protein [Betaproteobacteria bacterium]
MFEKTLIAGWGDMDFNAHMRNTAFLDKSADMRMMFFAEQGFPMAKFVELRVGPVVMHDEVDYYREVGLLEPLRATLELAGLADDGSRFTLRNEFFLADGKRSARVTSTGGWLDLAARRLIAAPADVLAALRVLTTTPDFRTLESSVK